MTPRPPLVVVLGATGFLGSALARALATRPVRLRVVARREATVPADPRARVEVCRADLTARDVLADAVRDADVVFPFAARIRGESGWRITADDVEAERTHVGLVRALVDAVERTPTVIFPGSNTQVGDVPSGRIDGSEEDRPVGVYDRQKQTAETILKDATTAGRLRAVSLRLPPVFGAPAAPTTDDRGVVSTMIRRALANQPLTMWHDGTPRRDLLNVEDAARAFLAAMDHVDALAGRHYVVGTGQARPLGEVFRTIADLVARHTGADPVPVVSVPPPPHVDGTDFRSVEVDPAAFERATGWRCELTLTEALDRTVAALAAATRSG